MFELNFEKLTALLKKESISIGEYTLCVEMEESGMNREQAFDKMKAMLTVMREAAKKAADSPLKSISGLTGGDAYRFHEYVRHGKSICGSVIANAMTMALSCSEVNASMQRIVACPTAGSCGIVPAAVLSAAKEYQKSEEDIIMALFTASGVGIVIGSRATLAGSEGGCQAECGAAASMAAAAVTEMLGGSPEQAFHAAAMALKNVMGLVCDPVAGLVEIPCIKRNASGACNAIICADLALAGVPSYIPFDDVVGAMYEVGKAISPKLRETSLGGLAATPTGEKLKQRVYAKSH